MKKKGQEPEENDAEGETSPPPPPPPPTQPAVLSLGIKKPADLLSPRRYPTSKNQHQETIFVFYVLILYFTL
jgi:hypothetical protein